MLKPLSLKAASIIILIGMLLSACSSLSEATPTDIEIEIGPDQLQVETFTPIPTYTPAPVSTSTPVPTEGPTIEPTITNTLDPYNELLAKGGELRNNQEFDQAAIQFTQAIAMQPENPQGYYERGRAFLDLGKYDEAITDFNFAINYDPNFAVAYNARGVGWAMKNQNTQALKDFDKAIELEPTLSSAYTNRAQFYVGQEDFEKALADYSKVIELRPDDFEAYVNRGQAYLAALQFIQQPTYADLCIADLDRVINLSPEEASSYFVRGQCYLIKGDSEKAYSDFSESIAKNPENYQVRLLRAAMYPEVVTKEVAMGDAQYVLDNATDADLKKQAQLILNDIPTLETLTLTPLISSTPTP